MCMHVSIYMYIFIQSGHVQYALVLHGLCACIYECVYLPMHVYMHEDMPTYVHLYVCVCMNLLCVCT